MKMCRKKILCAFLLVMLCVAVADASPTGNSKGEFMSLYASEWRLFNLNYRLFTLIDKEFDTHVKSMTFGAKGLPFIVNKGAFVEEIFSGVLTKFHKDYEEFLKHFNAQYLKVLQASNKSISEKLSKAPTLEDVLAIQREGERNMLDVIGAKFSERLDNRLMTPYTAGALLIIGLALIILRHPIAASVASGTPVIKRIKAVIVIAGLVIIAFGTYQFSRILFMTTNITREFLNEQVRALYVSDLPNSLWNVVEPYI